MVLVDLVITHCASCVDNQSGTIWRIKPPNTPISLKSGKLNGENNKLGLKGSLRHLVQILQ